MKVKRGWVQGIRFAQGVKCRNLLRIPTEREMFGVNKYGEKDDMEQWPCMKKRRNRIAFQGNNGDWEWYWLQNKRKNSASYFCLVDGGGAANASNASYSYGVRPVFLLS